MNILAKLKARDLSSFSSQPEDEKRVAGNGGSNDLSSFYSFFSYQQGMESAAPERATPPDAERAGYEKNEINEISPAWAGEYEYELSALPDCGDEAEHDAWLAGTPIAELSR